MFVKNGTGELKKVLVSRPEYLKPAPINEIAKKWKDTTMDVKVMLREHEEFVKSYEDAGIEVEFLDADDERPNSVFARDFGGCVKEGYILGNFKLDMRYKEHVDYEKRMAELGIPKIGEVKKGLFEGTVSVMVHNLGDVDIIQKELKKIKNITTVVRKEE